MSGARRSTGTNSARAPARLESAALVQLFAAKQARHFRLKRAETGKWVVVLLRRIVGRRHAGRGGFDSAGAEAGGAGLGTMGAETGAAA